MDTSIHMSQHTKDPHEGRLSRLDLMAMLLGAVAHMAWPPGILSQSHASAAAACLPATRPKKVASPIDRPLA